MSTRRHRVFRAGLLGLGLSLSTTWLQAAPMALSRVVIVRSDQVSVYFDVELAVTDEQRQRGLMGRSHLPPGSGMLFDFGYARHVGMWMKNTLIPLDMLFADAAGNILSIAGSAAPQSTRTIHGAAPTRYVLEINGGEAALRGIRPGDRLRPLEGFRRGAPPR